MEKLISFSKLWEEKAPRKKSHGLQKGSSTARAVPLHTPGNKHEGWKQALTSLTSLETCSTAQAFCKNIANILFPTVLTYSSGSQDAVLSSCWFWTAVTAMCTGRAPPGAAPAWVLSLLLKLEDAFSCSIAISPVLQHRRHSSFKCLTPANKRNVTLLLNADQVTRHYSYFKGSTEPPNF